MLTNGSSGEGAKKQEGLVAEGLAGQGYIEQAEDANISDDGKSDSGQPSETKIELSLCKQLFEEFVPQSLNEMDSLFQKGKVTFDSYCETPTQIM